VPDLVVDLLGTLPYPIIRNSDERATVRHWRLFELAARGYENTVTNPRFSDLVARTKAFVERIIDQFGKVTSFKGATALLICNQCSEMN
jgi:hypothetical protein